MPKSVKKYPWRLTLEAVCVNMEARGPKRSAERWCAAHAKLIGKIYGGTDFVSLGRNTQ